MKKKQWWKRPLTWIIAGLIAAASILLAVRSGGGATVDVYPVMYLAEEDWESETYGEILSGTSETYVRSSAEITDIYVKQGDAVKEGDPLFAYDTASLSLETEIACNSWQIAILQQKKAEETLARYQTYTPYQPIEPVTIDTMDQIPARQEDADGPIDYTAQPLEYNCSTEAKAYLVYLEELVRANVPSDPDDSDAEPPNITFCVYAPDGDGNDTLAGTVMVACTEENLNLIHNYVAIPWTTWEVGSYFLAEPGQKVLVNEDMISRYTDEEGNSFASVHPADITLAPATEVPEERSYTQEEINQMIVQAKQDVTTARVTVMQKKLEYDQAASAMNDGVVRAGISGTVTVLNDYSSLNSGEAFLTVSSGDAYIVQTTVGEMQRDAVKVGDQITVNAVMTGNVFQAEVTFVGDTPYQPIGYYSEDPNSTAYLVRASISADQTVDLANESWVQVSLPTSSAEGFYLPVMMVRRQDGQSYVYKMDESGRLARQTVRTGKTLYGSSIMILDGLSRADYIAFPYGKAVEEGAKCTMQEDVSGLYGY